MWEVVFADGRVVQIAWLAPLDPGSMPDWGRRGARALWEITACVSASSADRRTVYRDVLRGILARVGLDDIVIVSADASDQQAQRDLRETGFEPFARRVTRRGVDVLEPLR